MTLREVYFGEKQHAWTNHSQFQLTHLDLQNQSDYEDWNKKPKF